MQVGLLVSPVVFEQTSTCRAPGRKSMPGLISLLALLHLVSSGAHERSIQEERGEGAESAQLQAEEAEGSGRRRKEAEGGRFSGGRRRG